MKLSEMYGNMQARYDVYVEEVRKSEDAAEKKAEADRNTLKDIIYEIVKTVRHKPEDNMQESIYQTFLSLREICRTRLKKIKTSLRCTLTNDGFFLEVCVNDLTRVCQIANSAGNHIKLDSMVMKQLEQHLVDHYDADKYNIHFRLEFLLDNNTVKITYDFEGAMWKLKQDFKKIFPKGSVHCINGVVLSLD